MTTSGVRRVAALFCLVAGVTAAAVSHTASGFVRTEDRNHDSRPDVWRTYDAHGQLTLVAFDTNFDGRSDVREYYTAQSLARRESDRNFDDRVDLVEEFDPSTREHTRSVVDVNYDGTADLLVLLQNGTPVFSTWTHPPAADLALQNVTRRAPVAARQGDDALAPLGDPFEGSAAMRPWHVVAVASGSVGLSTSGGLPSDAIGASSPVLVRADVALADLTSATSTAPLVRSPRGPPLSRS